MLHAYVRGWGSGWRSPASGLLPRRPCCASVGGQPVRGLWLPTSGIPSPQPQTDLRQKPHLGGPTAETSFHPVILDKGLFCHLPCVSRLGHRPCSGFCCAAGLGGAVPVSTRRGPVSARRGLLAVARPCMGVKPPPLSKKHGICYTLPRPPPSLPETLPQLCLPERSREPQKGAPWGSGLGESLLEERLYKAVVGNFPGAGPLFLACTRSWRPAASFCLDWQKGPAVGHSGSELAGHDV